MAFRPLTQEYLQMPVVTRAYTTACVLTTLAVVRIVYFIYNVFFCRFTLSFTIVSIENGGIFTMIVIIIILQQLDLVSPFQLYLNPILIIHQYQVINAL